MIRYEAIRAVDRANLLDDVLAMPAHARDALFRAESARLEPVDARGVLVCGVGGSAIGADLARAALGPRLVRPLVTVRDYALPAGASADDLVLCSSYSGGTEEALSCFAAAGEVGARRIVATTGGRLGEEARAAGAPVIPMPAALQPRAAFAYLFVAAIEVAAVAKAGPSLRDEIEAAAMRVSGRVDELADQAAEIARRLDGVTPLIYGADLTAPLAYRWKTQVNENAKVHAFAHELPEMNHNEIVGWSGGGAPFAAVFLADPDQHPRKRQRIELTAELVAPGAADVITVETKGETRTERVLAGVMLGDLVSLELAALRGVDPTPVDVIERLKDELGRP